MSDSDSFKKYTPFIYNLIMLIGIIIFMILHFYYFHNMTKIKCKCVNNDYKKNIQVFIIIQLILFSLITILSFIYIQKPNHIILFINKFLFLLAIISMFINTYYIKLFLTSVEDNKCKCSKSGTKTFINVINKIKIILFAIYIIIALSIPIIVTDFFNKTKNNLKDEWESVTNQLKATTESSSNTLTPINTQIVGSQAPQAIVPQAPQAIVPQAIVPQAPQAPQAIVPSFAAQSTTPFTVNQLSTAAPRPA
jgi:hypothetical protein